MPAEGSHAKSASELVPEAARKIMFNPERIAQLHRQSKTEKDPLVLDSMVKVISSRVKLIPENDVKTRNEYAGLLYGIVVNPNTSPQTIKGAFETYFVFGKKIKSHTEQEFNLIAAMWRNPSTDRETKGRVATYIVDSKDQKLFEYGNRVVRGESEFLAELLPSMMRGEFSRRGRQHPGHIPGKGWRRNEEAQASRAQETAMLVYGKASTTQAIYIS